LIIFENFFLASAVVILLSMIGTSCIVCTLGTNCTTQTLVVNSINCLK
jgi:hypothetical protein